MATTDTPTETPAEASTAERAGHSERLRQTDLAQQIQFLAAKARARGTAHANRMLTAELDLKVRQFSVLSLAASGLNPTQRELSQFLDLDPSQIVALVDGLEQRGLVLRETDPTDRRSRIIVATDAGRSVRDRGQAITEASDDAVLADLTAQEREQLRALLTKIAF